MDGQRREGYAGGNMTTGSVRESADTGRRIASGGTNTTWRVYDGNGGSLPSSVLGLRYLFQGREYSWTIHAATGGTGLYYFRARYYDPFTGRWLSNDTIGISGGLNQYAFCANNPVMFVDPSGTDFRGTIPDRGRGQWSGPMKGIGSIQSIDNLSHPGAASTGKSGALGPVTIRPGGNGGSATAPNGDIDFIYPTKDRPINGKTDGAFKIGPNDAYLEPDTQSAPGMENNPKLSNFGDPDGPDYIEHAQAKGYPGYPEHKNHPEDGCN